MVQGGLLTAHPGGDHGDEEASEGQSSLRQGAGTASPGDPEIGIAAAVNSGRNRIMGLLSRVFVLSEINRRKVGSMGGPT